MGRNRHILVKVLELKPKLESRNQNKVAKLKDNIIWQTAPQGKEWPDILYEVNSFQVIVLRNAKARNLVTSPFRKKTAIPTLRLKAVNIL